GATGGREGGGAGGRGRPGGWVVPPGPAGMVAVLAPPSASGRARLQVILAARHCDTITAGPGSLSAKLSAYETCVRGGLLQEYREIFLVAAALCGLAAVVAVATLPSRAARLVASQPGRPEAALE